MSETFCFEFVNNLKIDEYSFFDRNDVHIFIIYMEGLLNGGNKRALYKLDPNIEMLELCLSIGDFPLAVEYMCCNIKGFKVDENNYLFLMACKNGLTKTVEKMIKIGFEHSAYYNGGLNMSIMKNYYHIFKILIKKMPDLYVADRLVIKYMLKYKRYDMFDYAIKKRYIDVNFDNGFMFKYCISHVELYPVAIYLVSNGFDMCCLSEYWFNVAERDNHEIYILMMSVVYMTSKR